MIGSGFGQPMGVVVDGSGNVFIADPYHGQVVEEMPSAGGYTQVTVESASGSSPLYPMHLAVDGSGNLYIADPANNQVLKETLSVSGYTESGLIFAGLNGPSGVAVDGSGNVYIADTRNNRVLMETPTVGGYNQTTIPSSSLNQPGGVAVDANGNIYISDTGNNRVLKETPLPGGGYAETKVGTFSGPSDMAVDSLGNVYVSASLGKAVLKEDYSDVPSLAFASTPVGTTSPDSPQTVTVANIGNAVLYFPDPTMGNNPSIATNFSLNSNATNACPVVSSSSSQPGSLAPAGSCVLSINSTPTVAGALLGSLVLTDNNLNALAPAYALQTIQLIGKASPGSPVITWPIPAPINYGTKLSGAELNATANVPGTFVYTPAVGVILNVGVQTLSVTFTPNDTTDYTTATQTVQLTVNPLTTTASELQFIPVTPCRVVDTRNAPGPFGGPQLNAGSTRTFNIPQSACGIPATAVAYSLNVTAVPIAPLLAYLTIWPAGQSQPYVSTLNSDGRTKANAAIVTAGTNGGVSVYAHDETQVILDIDGYFVPAGTSSSGLQFFPLTPCRIADTRNSDGPLGGPMLTGRTSRDFPVHSSSCGIPATAQAYSLNITAIPHAGSLGWLTAWPSGQAQPWVSTLNSTTGTITANAAIVPAGAGGDVSIFVSDAADVVLDVNGYFALPATGGLSLYTTTPCRVLDTRYGARAFNGTMVVPVQDSGCAPPATAQAYVLNATVVPAGALSYLTLWANGGAQPYVSTLNALDGAITSNMAIVPTTDGSIDGFSSNSTQLILDLSGYFAP